METDGLRATEQAVQHLPDLRGQVLKLSDSEGLGAHRVLERPKVFANARTGKFLMYAHLDNAHY